MRYVWKDQWQKKLFFLNQIPTGAVDTIVDFGCADGCLFQAMRQLGIDWKQIGIDNEVAFKELFLIRNPNATWIRSQYPALDNVADPKHCILNLSSVIHEVYSYMDPKQVELFWKAVFESGFQYIVCSGYDYSLMEKTQLQISFDLCKTQQ